MKAEWDVAIVGAGIIGLATALALTEKLPDLRIVVLEKERRIALHQSGNNSGIIHSGLYYRPGSLKAQMCARGAERIVAFCDEHGIAHTREGKVVVAIDESEIPALDELFRRGMANGITGLRELDRSRLDEFEPHAAGIAGLYVPTTGAVDFGEVAAAIAELLEARGVRIVTSFELIAVNVKDGFVTMDADDRTITVGGMLNCAGLFSDRVAAMAGVVSPIRIIPFRGEYYDVVGPSADLVGSSIYRVPDPALPFLGVHVSRTAKGTVHAGPNAVLAGSREGYSWTMTRPRDLWDSMSYPGMRHVAKRHWRSGISEVARSLSRRRFAHSVQELVPGISATDLRKGTAGVRAQAVTPEGQLYDDFLVVPGQRTYHVLNAPSPGATSSLVIGEYLASRVAAAFDLG